MCEFESVEVYLPDSVKEIVSIIGLPATEKLVKSFGGMGFYLAKGSSYYFRMLDVIGKEAIETLSAYFGGSYLYLPKCEVALRVLRNQRLNADFLEMTENGKMSGRTAMWHLSQKYHLSDRQGWDIVYSFRRNPVHSQPLLF